MQVHPIGFGGAEIGFEVSGHLVATLLNDALDAGLNVIDTGECYRQSEELIEPSRGSASPRILPIHKVRPR